MQQASELASGANVDVQIALIGAIIGGVIVAIINWCAQRSDTRQQQNYRFIVEKRSEFRNFLRRKALEMVQSTDPAQRVTICNEVQLRTNPCMKKEVDVFEAFKSFCDDTTIDLLEKVQTFVTYEFNRANIEATARLFKNWKLKFFTDIYWDDSRDDVKDVCVALINITANSPNTFVFLYWFIQYKLVLRRNSK